MRKLLATTALMGLVFAATPAGATQIIAFGQTSNNNTVFGIDAFGATTITSSTQVLIDQIIAGPGIGTHATFTLNAHSTGPATAMGVNVTQDFSGTFSVKSGINNYLSGTFADAVFGTGGSLTLAVSAETPGETVSFTSGTIPVADLVADQSFSLSMTNVTPAVHITNGSLGSFSAAFTGTASASPAAVPEPASVALLGVGLLGIGFVANRKRSV